jgi:hypothetical protein
LITDEDIACLRCEGPAEAGFVAALGRFGGRPATVGSGGSTGVMRFCEKSLTNAYVPARRRRRCRLIWFRS